MTIPSSPGVKVTGKVWLFISKGFALLVPTADNRTPNTTEIIVRSERFFTLTSSYKYCSVDLTESISSGAPGWSKAN